MRNVKNQLENRRDGMEDGDTVILNGIEDLLWFHLVDDGNTQPCFDHDIQDDRPGDMGDGNDKSPGILLGDGEGMVTRFWEIGQVIVGENNSFRSSCRPRGVKVKGFILFLKGNRNPLRGFLLDDLFIGVPIPDIFVLGTRHHNMLQGGDRFSHPIDEDLLPNAGDDCRNLGLLKDGFHLSRAETEVEDHGDGPDFQDGEVGHTELRAVLKKENDTVPFLNPRVKKSIGQPVGKGIEVRESDLFFFEENGGLIGLFEGLFLKKIPDDHKGRLSLLKVN